MVPPRLDLVSDFRLVRMSGRGTSRLSAGSDLSYSSSFAL